MKMLQDCLHWLVLCLCSRFLFIHGIEVCNEEGCYYTEVPSPDPATHSAKRSTSETQHQSEVCIADDGIISPGKDVHRVGVKASGVKAIDLCLVVSAAVTMAGSQRWTQSAIAHLEESLRATGIGSSEEYPNRYCLTMFGSRGRFLTARFLEVEDEIFFPASKFFMARRQLKRNGDVADGYQAVEFTALNAPFREDPNIAKVIVLVTDMGRSVLAASANLTREVLSDILHNRGLMFNVVVATDINVTDGPHSTRLTDTVLGIHGDFGSAIVLRDNGDYEIVNGSLSFKNSAGNTIYDYITLAVAMDGCAWPIRLLREESESTLASFSAAFIDHHFMPLQNFTVCEKCICVQDRHGATLDCQQPLNQELCYCLVNRSALECSAIVPTPTAVLLPLSSSLHVTSLLAPAQTPVKIIIDGNATVLPNGDVEVTFQSNVDKVSFECVVFNCDKDMPELLPCSSPYSIEGLPEGEHTLFVLGRKWGQQATKLFTFKIVSDDPFQVMAEQLPGIDAEGNIRVNLAANRQNVKFQCSLGGNEFTECQSPHSIDPEDLQLEDLASQIFIAVATDRRCNAASAVITITPPPPPEPRQLMIEASVDAPTIFGIVRINYKPTEDAASCACSLNPPATCLENHNAMLNQPMLCRDEGTTGFSIYKVNPRNFTGDYCFRITCMMNSISTTEEIKINVPPPPPVPVGELQCRLNLTSSDDEGTHYFVDFSCNRLVEIISCKVSSQPSMQLCQSKFQFDTSDLEPGKHTFALTAHDGYGNSVEQTYLFEVVGVGRRRCCPEILPNSTALTTDSSHTHVELQLLVAAGNCSQSERFSYVVHWGDGSRSGGNSTSLGAVRTTKWYSVTPDQIKADYCNNPPDSSNKCCDSLVLPVKLNPA